jgi:ubiquinol-cytochrome c reductase iron-sulfur subunit
VRKPDRIVLVLLGLTSLAAIGFIAVYLTGNDTQLLGLSLGLAFVFLAVAAVIAGKRIVDQRKGVEERRPVGVARDAEEAIHTIDRIAQDATGEPPPPLERISRRTLVLGAAGAAGALGAALIVPIASIGSKVGDQIVDTPWHPGRMLVDDQGNPISLDDIAVGTFLPAFPEGASKRDLGSSLVVVRILPEELDLPSDRQGWSVDGVLAFSRICPHAACAISLFRYPLYEPTSPGPALVCPCHYSTFDVRNGGERIFGPAGRALPQLPLALDSQGRLLANGEFSEPPGPSYLSTRRWTPEDNLE